MHYFLTIYFNKKPIHVSSRLAAHHQEDQFCINSSWYIWYSCSQPVKISHDCKNCCLYRVDPPDDEQQACSKRVDAYYWNKLIESSASFWFMLCDYMRTYIRLWYYYYYYYMHYYDSCMCVVCSTAHNTHTALRHAATSPNLYNDIILPSILT